MYHLTKHNPNYLTDFGSTCSCNSNMGMITPANIATLGAMEMGRTLSSYDRAIVRVKSKISKLKAQKKRVKLKARARLIQKQIDVLRAKLKKLEGYRKIRANRKPLFKGKDSDVAIAEDEDQLLLEAIQPEPLVNELDLTEFETQEIADDGMGLQLWQMALLGLVGAGVMYLGVKKLKPNPRKRRVIGKKRNNPKRKTVAKRRKARKK
jgi:hypothetical protein